MTRLAVLTGHDRLPERNTVLA